MIDDQHLRIKPQRCMIKESKFVSCDQRSAIGGIPKKWNCAGCKKICHDQWSMIGDSPQIVAFRRVKKGLVTLHSVLSGRMQFLYQYSYRSVTVGFFTCPQWYENTVVAQWLYCSILEILVPHMAVNRLWGTFFCYQTNMPKWYTIWKLLTSRSFDLL